jgi:alpha-tubulin suppressor-like RCC1 family protein
MDRFLIVFEFVWLWIDVDLFAAGNVVCSWGRGEDGQLGHGDTDDRLLPTQLSALDAQQIVSVVCGADHTLAYSESKVEVYSWGWYASFSF